MVINCDEADAMLKKGWCDCIFSIEYLVRSKIVDKKCVPVKFVDIAMDCNNSFALEEFEKHVIESMHTTYFDEFIIRLSLKEGKNHDRMQVLFNASNMQIKQLYKEFEHKFIHKAIEDCIRNMLCNLIE